MPSDRPDPSEFLEMAQRMLREMFGGASGSHDPWAEATRPERSRGPSEERQRQNLTFALATRAVEALEDLALNVAAIRQRLERTTTPRDADATPEDAAPKDATPKVGADKDEAPRDDATADDATGQ